MIKRSPQEIADFCQGYVFNSCSASSWVVTPDKPKIVNGEWTWDHDSILWFTLPVYTLDVPVNHHWTHLYEPNYQKPTDSDNKPDHLGEVYTHKEYVLLGEFQPNVLAQKVNELLQDGFRLYGNPWTGPDSSYGYIHYQAMVRGV